MIRDTLGLRESLQDLAAPELLPSDIYYLLQGYSPISILANALASDSDLVRQRCNLYLDKLRYVKTSLDGEALQQMGVAPGPLLGELKRTLHEARLDQRVKTRKGEEELARRWLSGQT